MSTFIKMSEMHISQPPCVMHTVVGSCIVLCLWDRRQRIGGMAHIMLPERNGDRHAPPAKYADAAVETLVAQMIERGASRIGLTAACVGGASMFQNGGNGETIGTRNYRSVKRMLESMRIPIVTESVGGKSGRKVTLSCEDGTVSIVALKGTERQ